MIIVSHLYNVFYCLSVCLTCVRKGVCSKQWWRQSSTYRVRRRIRIYKHSSHGNCWCRDANLKERAILSSYRFPHWSVQDIPNDIKPFTYTHILLTIICLIAFLYLPLYGCLLLPCSTVHPVNARRSFGSPIGRTLHVSGVSKLDNLLHTHEAATT